MATENKDKFSYSYSASEQDELRKIRARYAEDKASDPLERVRRLDESVTRIPTVIALILGVVGTLILGAGMSLIMTDLGANLSLGYAACWGIGLSLGLVGIATAAAAYPIYSAVLRRRKRKVGPEILALLDGMMD